MSDLTFTKIAGAGIATALGLFAVYEMSGILIPAPGGHGHHGDHHAEEKTLNEKIQSKFAYYVTVPEPGAAAGAIIEEVFDLGAALASADIKKGERVFKGNCATCHTIEEGGANGTGPNLWNTIGVPKAGHAGFNYSPALSGMGGEWTFENMDAWLKNPSAYVSGTSMSYSGVRKDQQRADLIAYMTTFSPNAPAFPDPLPEVTEASAEGEGEAVEAEVTAEDLETAPGEATGVIETIDTVDGTEANTGDAGETELAPAIEGEVTAPAELANPSEADEANVTEAIEEAVETVEDAANQMEMPDEVTDKNE